MLVWLFGSKFVMVAASYLFAVLISKPAQPGKHLNHQNFTAYYQNTKLTHAQFMHSYDNPVGSLKNYLLYELAK